MMHWKWYLRISLILLNVMGNVAWAADGAQDASLQSEILDIIPIILGLATFVCLVTTYLAGRSMAKDRARYFKRHRKMATITLVVAVCHVVAVVVLD